MKKINHVLYRIVLYDIVLLVLCLYFLKILLSEPDAAIPRCLSPRRGRRDPPSGHGREARQVGPGEQPRLLGGGAAASISDLDAEPGAGGRSRPPGLPGLFAPAARGQGARRKRMARAKVFLPPK